MSNVNEICPFFDNNTPLYFVRFHHFLDTQMQWNNH